MQGRQIFETDSSSRWKRFKWSSRILLLLIPLAIVLILAWFLTEKLPEVPQFSAYRQALNEKQNFLSRNSLLAKKYKGYRQYINKKDRIGRSSFAFNHPAPPGTLNKDVPIGIRSAFYVTWNQASFRSLERNIHKLNLVIPEWIFIDPRADTLITGIDAK